LTLEAAAGTESPAWDGGGGGAGGRSWPALAQVGAGPHAACVHYGDAVILPHRSRPSRAGEGSRSDG
jgi:hypothetical protein